MNYGTEICRTLKAIRKRIAELNNLEYTPEECTHENECTTGTCAACEEELCFIESQLKEKLLLGETISIDGIYSLESNEK